jgi:flagellar motor protein MotB
VLKPAGQKALEKIAAVLATIDDRQFLVAGHTDNVPIRTGKYASNWELSTERAVNVVHLIYRRHGWEGSASDFEFSRATMDHHWQEGAAAIAETMRHDSLLARNIVSGRTAAFDLAV